MLRRSYTCRCVRAARRWAFAAGFPLTAAGCSFGALGGGDGPVTTGSLTAPVVVQRPLPETLAYSDAAKIGQAASAALWQVEGGAAGDWTPEDWGPGDWVNARTGSSGTLTAEPGSADEKDCRPFSTIVTSLGGVHQYSGTLCREDDAQAVLTIEEAGL